MANETFDSTVTVRCMQSDIDLFKDHCATVLNRDFSGVLREMIVALPDNRLTLTQTPEQIAASEQLYKS